MARGRRRRGGRGLAEARWVRAGGRCRILARQREGVGGQCVRTVRPGHWAACVSSRDQQVIVVLGCVKQA